MVRVALPLVNGDVERTMATAEKFVFPGTSSSVAAASPGSGRGEVVRRALERLASGLSAPIADVRLALGRFGPRGWLAAAGAGLATLLVVGLVTAISENPLFIRMTPVRPQDYVVWLASGLLVGLIAGTFVGPAPARHGGKAISGGALSLLAVACPICNKLVVLLLGVSGALTIFGPAQLYLGALSVGLLAWTFRLRARAVAQTCSAPGYGPREAGKPGAVSES